MNEALVKSIKSSVLESNQYTLSLRLLSDPALVSTQTFLICLFQLLVFYGCLGLLCY